MKVVALVSGGKDSTYNVMQCVAAGHTIVALANLEPDNQGELDSYMYQSVGHEGVALLGKALGLPLFRKTTSGKAHHQGKDYIPTNNDEVEDLYELLQSIQEEISFDAVAVGAILSDYQRIRVENICTRLGLISLAYLWRRNQTDLLNEMIECGVRAVIVKVAALGLEPGRHLGVPVGVLRPHLQRMNDKYGLHVCGEGGEYETFTLDCPLYTNTIVVDESETIIHSDDGIAPVGYLRFTKLHLNPKEVTCEMAERLKGIPIKNPLSFVADIEDSENIECNNRFENVDLDAEEQHNTSTENEYVRPVPGESCEIQHPVNYGQSNGWLWIGGLVGYSEDPAEAMSNALTKLKCCLNEVGFTIRDVCAVTMYVSDMNKYAVLNKAYCKVFKYINPPARVCIQCPLDKNAPVLLDALAYSVSTAKVPVECSTEERSDEADDDVEERIIPDRVTLHVQGISHWAPANIGPYSQAIQVGDIIRVAGQIGMVPGTLELIEGGVLKQCRVSLRHVGRIVAALDSNMQLRDVVQGVCYVTHPNHIGIARKEWEKRTNNAIVDYLVVSHLPKGALVEWHFWAHKHNNQFEYEETGQCVGDHLLSIRRRFNYENKVSAIVCYVEHRLGTCDELSPELMIECLEYSLSKLNQHYASGTKPVCNLRFFYPVSHKINLVNLHTILAGNKLKYNIVYTVIPVCQLQSPKTLLSVCGVRYE